MSTPARLLYRQAIVRPKQTAWIEDCSDQSAAIDRRTVEPSPRLRSLTWFELCVVIANLAERLRQEGVQPSDRVVTRFPNGWQAVSAALALQWLGAVESPIDCRWGDNVAAELVSRVDAKLVLDQSSTSIPSFSHLTEQPFWFDDGALRGFRESAASASSCGNQLGIIHWTSGTSARPKGVMLQRKSLVLNAIGKLRAAPQTSSDRRLMVLPLSHAYARTCDLMTWLATGGALAAGSGWQGLEGLAPLVHPTVMNLVPSLIDRLIDGISSRDVAAVTKRLQELGLDQLRMLGCGGAPLSPEQFEWIAAAGIAPIQGYGLTEAGPVICSSSPMDCRPGVVGRPVRRTQVRIGERGEIQARGPGLMLGYWRDSGATAERLAVDGWLSTGDEGRLEPDGQLSVLGRLDDVIVMPNGTKFNPLAMEAELCRRAEVAHVVLVAAGRHVMAIVDPTNHFDEERFRLAYATLKADAADVPALTRVCQMGRNWSVAGGELTLKGTVRRQVIAERLHAILAASSMSETQ